MSDFKQFEHKQDSRDGGTTYLIPVADSSGTGLAGQTFHVVPKAGGGSKVRIQLPTDAFACAKIGAALERWAMMGPNSKLKVRGVDGASPADLAEITFEWDDLGNGRVYAVSLASGAPAAIQVNYLRFQVTTRPDATATNDSVAFCEWCRLVGRDMRGLSEA